MDADLEQCTQRLREAQSPEDVFGSFEGSGEEQLKQATVVYRQLAKAVHPDRYRQNGDQTAAHEAFKALQYWWREAQAKIKLGIYGTVRTTKPEPLLVQSGRRKYAVGEQMARGDICNLYLCTSATDPKSAVFKVAREPRDNDLMANEARILKQLLANKEWSKFHAYLPQIYDAFGYKDAASVTRHANVISYLDGFYSLKEVQAEYPNGVEAKDMAWIWRRLLVALGLAHVNHIIHGAVLPDHVLIQPELHGLTLIDWTCAVAFGDPDGLDEHIQALSLEYEPWYPQEVLSKKPPVPGTDIYMAAQCMVYLLGGNPLTGEIPKAVSKPIARFFRGCLLPNPKSRPQEAWALIEEFDELIERLWGPKTFRLFSMRPRA